ncbi:MAG: BON domain-containing protein [Actinobacteria bacterium]|nr:BON domain-containing protein [Actinomycetota bacterium]
MRKLLGLLGLGAALKYLLDPEKGSGRRTMLRDRVGGMLRSRSRRLGAQTQDVSEAVEKGKDLKKTPTDDVTLARKVETEIFRDDDVPKGQINVNAENGKIVLRGEVGEQEMIVDLEERARNVQGVSDVENLLHLPGAPAPMHE